MDGFINVHCHIINFQFIPDTFFKTRAPFREWLYRSSLTRWLARIITFLIPGSEYDRLHEFLSIFKKDINEVAEILLREMKEANIKLSIPLVMDLEYASFNTKPEVPFRHQIQLISQIALQYPGQLLPFVMVDPRRPDAADMITEALERLGYLGVKFYPPFGHHPYHKSFYNEPHVNEELNKIYTYCHQNKIPITTHCTIGGAYGSEVMKYRELEKELTKPSNWRQVLEDFPELHLNLAHFGGDFLDIEKPTSWSYEIKQMIEEFDNVYTDLSYSNKALERETTEQYFQQLNTVLEENSKSKERILFGTDWSMTRHTWTEAEYIAPFNRELNRDTMNQIAVRNPMKFLFPANIIPERINKFMRDNGKSLPTFLTDHFKTA